MLPFLERSEKAKARSKEDARGSKESTHPKYTFYTMKFPAEINEAFDVVKEKLGFGKAECVRRSVMLLAELATALESGRELVLSVRQESDKKLVKEKIISFDALRSPDK
jgi:hypothetical protein